MKSNAFRKAAESKDFSAVEDLFTEDVTFRSPVVFTPYEGREVLGVILGTVAQVFQDFRYTDHTETGDTATLAFSARVGDKDLDGIDLLRFDESGKIRELQVYIRPMSGMMALAGEMKSRLEAAGAA